jgi:hypothetical protein
MMKKCKTEEEKEALHLSRKEAVKAALRRGCSQRGREGE